MSATVLQGDCIEVMRSMPENSVDSIVTDPPYGLGFMGKGWDALPPGLGFAKEAYRVLKPGAHLLAFGGTRTWHRLAVAVEDAGFEIRDSIAWLYGSGFPKSLNVGKVVAGFEGWGTALKPAFEPIVVARKPLIGTVAANVLEYGTGALNIDGSRIGTEVRVNPPAGNKPGGTSLNLSVAGMPTDAGASTAVGRFPANVILDESQAAALDEQSGTSKSTKGKPRGSARPGEGWGMTATGAEYDDVDGASRFFYCAKAPKGERPVVNGVAHPTVKPLTLMRYLVKLVTPPGGVVLDPFAGSGATVEAALLEGFDVTGIEREADYLPLVNFRVGRAA